MRGAHSPVTCDDNGGVSRIAGAVAAWCALALLAPAASSAAVTWKRCDSEDVTQCATLPVPHPVAKSLLTNLWRYRLSSFPAPELDHIRYVCMVDGTRAREQLGFKPRYTLKETIRAVNAA